jgi:hypothetical protein
MSGSGRWRADIEERVTAFGSEYLRNDAFHGCVFADATGRKIGWNDGSALVFEGAQAQTAE